MYLYVVVDEDGEQLYVTSDREEAVLFVDYEAEQYDSTCDIIGVDVEINISGGTMYE